MDARVVELAADDAWGGAAASGTTGSPSCGTVASTETSPENSSQEQKERSPSEGQKVSMTMPGKIEYGKAIGIVTIYMVCLWHLTHRDAE